MKILHSNTYLELSEDEKRYINFTVNLLRNLLTRASDADINELETNLECYIQDIVHDLDWILKNRVKKES